MNTTCLPHQVGSYEVCNTPERIDAEYGSFCNSWCRSRILCTGSAASLRRQCRTVRPLVNFSDELHDLRAANERGRLSHAEYLALARSHRFCLVAPGDFVATHKITEAMALGGSGGCIPVFVLARSTPNGHGMLPYTRWLDYCSVAYVVHERTARHDAAVVVRALLAVSAAEAHAKLRALARVRDAFVFRGSSSHGSSAQPPSAAEYILDEACAAARSFSAAFKGKGSPGGGVMDGGSKESSRRGALPWHRGHDLSRCTLGPGTEH